MAGPWDSPKFVTQKSLPRVLPDMKKMRGARKKAEKRKAYTETARSV
jgi:hypothetical protein